MLNTESLSSRPAESTSESRDVALNVLLANAWQTLTDFFNVRKANQDLVRRSGLHATLITGSGSIDYHIK